MPGVPREIDPQALDEYLTYQYVPHPRTIFRGIAKLPPGHYAVYRDGRLDVRPYWQPDFNARGRPARREEYARRACASCSTSSVEMRLQSEVPLGAFLSGGIDSTIIVGLMSQLAGEPVRTFSIGFPVKEFDETRYARQAAERFGTIHEEFQVRPDAMEVLPRLVWHYDEPFADSSAVPTWYVSQLTRQHVTVALTGDGGDELFAGYPRYLAVWLAEGFDRLPALVRRTVAGGYWQRLPVRHAAEIASPAIQAVRRDARPAAGAALSGMDRDFRRGPARSALQRRVSGRDCPTAEPLDFLTAALARCDRRDAGDGLQPGRPGDLSAVRPDDEGGHRLDGPRAGVPAAVSRLSRGGAGGADAGRLKFRRGRGKRILRETFRRPAAASRSSGGRRWASACRWTTGSATS